MSERKTNKKYIAGISDSNLSLPCTSLFIIFSSEAKLLLKWVNILEELC